MNEELKELKAQAYDLIAVMEVARKQLDAINLKIAELSRGKNESHTELSAVSNG